MTKAALIVFALGVASLLVASSAAKIPMFMYRDSGDKWGSLSANWAKCSGGTQQSPVDIVKDALVYNATLKAVKRDYANANATLINNGFNIQLRYEEGVGIADIQGKNYSLQELHWHVPSEHTLDGKRLSAELQLVHKTADGNLAVISTLYNPGRPDQFIAQFDNELKKLKKITCKEDEQAQVQAGIVMNKALSRSARKYYTYIGSLTAPPCTENVIWIIMARVKQISEQQINALTMPLTPDFRSNSRPTQPINGRKIMLYDELHNVAGQNDKDNDKKDAE